MEKLSKNEAVIGFGSLDLAQMRNWAEDIGGSWNGRDDQFLHDGSVYGEDVAVCASDIVEKIDELKELLGFMNENI